MRLWNAVVERAGGEPVTVADVCATVMAAAGVDGVTIVVPLADRGRETVYVSGQVASDGEDLTETLGEGPGVDAVTNGPVFAADLASAEGLAGWPVFGPAALDAGIRAVFGIPLRVGAIRLGVMDLYRRTPGALDPDQLADALILGDVACALLLDAVPTAGSTKWLNQTGPHHPEVHQATGMITVQLGVSAAVALVRLRAYAFAHDRGMRDVAADVVARRLRFVPDSEGAGTIETSAPTARIPYDEGD
jgi:hypothetical protein